MKNQSPKEYPCLSKSYKGMFPFKIATTSFIYPDRYVPNVRMLGPYLDEIELLLFQSQGPDTLPPKRVITELERLAAEFRLGYNVHLPTDVSLSDTSPVQQSVAVETLKRVIDLVTPLDPSALILHLPYDETSFAGPVVRNWQNRVFQNLSKIISRLENGKIIAVENLDYPLEMLADIIVDLNLSICLDLGHLMVYEYDIPEVFGQYAPKTSVLHLHGVENGQDHITLARLPDNLFAAVQPVLKKFTGVVSLEVFSFKDLQSSLKFLESHWKQR